MAISITRTRPDISFRRYARGQTDRQTVTLITILYSPIRGVVRMMKSIVCIGPIAVALELPYAQQLDRLIGQLPYCYRPSLITGKHTILYEMLF